MTQIRLSLNKEFKENIVALNCDLIAGCLRANFEIIEDDTTYESLRFIKIKGNFNIVEYENVVIITDLQTLNNVMINKELIWEMEAKF